MRFLFQFICVFALFLLVSCTSTIGGYSRYSYSRNRSRPNPRRVRTSWAYKPRASRHITGSSALASWKKTSFLRKRDSGARSDPHAQTSSIGAKKTSTTSKSRRSFFVNTLHLYYSNYWSNFQKRITDARKNQESAVYRNQITAGALLCVFRWM